MTNDLPLQDAEPTLFSLGTRETIDQLEVTRTQRLVTDYWITINSVRFDAEDVYSTLEETCSDLSDSYISNSKLVDALKSIHVIVHGGSRRWAMSPERGPNYDYFMDKLRKQLEKE